MSDTETKTFESRFQKLNVAMHLTSSIYNRKYVSKNTKLRHCQTIIRPEALYAAECLNIATKGNIKKLEAQERQIIRKIYGPITKHIEDNFVRYNRPNSELYQNCEKMSHDVKKRRLAFYGNLHGMDNTRLTKQIFDYFRVTKCPPLWFRNSRKDLQALQISTQGIENRSALRDKLKRAMFQVDDRKEIGSEERRLATSKRMKAHI